MSSAQDEKPAITDGVGLHVPAPVTEICDDAVSESDEGIYVRKNCMFLKIFLQEMLLNYMAKM